MVGVEQEGAAEEFARHLPTLLQRLLCLLRLTLRRIRCHLKHRLGCSTSSVSVPGGSTVQVSLASWILGVQQ